MRKIPLLLGGLLACVLHARDVTFISTSDSHYRQSDHPRGHHNELNRASIEEMNRITTREWPEKLGGGAIATPRGVLSLGDLIDDGDLARGGRNLSEEQFRLYLADFGFDGTDGLLKFRVYDGFGNHDGPPIGREKNGFSTQGRLRERNLERQRRGWITNLSTNGLHYSWDWDDVHFVQLNIYPADRQNPKVKYSPVWHDPQGALAFLREDLAAKVGDSGRPVVLAAHCGFDTDWWVAEDWATAYEAANRYNIVLYVYGHTGTGVGAWAPGAGDRKWTWINDGHTDTGFFVIRITDDRLRAAYRVKAGLRVGKDAEGRKVNEWSGEWGWKFPVDQPLPAAAEPGGR